MKPEQVRHKAHKRVAIGSSSLRLRAQLSDLGLRRVPVRLNVLN